ncbi:MAG: Hsp33 family molecular chaperone HslO [Clostridia bacterium]|nr:Hsp33 family molecular chaperone HslO [Clostridia bacterium]
MLSKLVRCITADGLVMAAAIDSTDIVRKAQELHRTTPVITSALGRLLTGASIMGNKLKEDNASLTLRMNGGGPAGSIIAVSDSKGNVRGYAQEAGLLLMPNARGQLDVSGAIGKEGTLTVMKDYGYGQPYCSQIPLVTGEVAEDLTAYYAISEQVPTIFCIGVHFDGLWKLDKAGGLLIQLMPAADYREIERLEEMLKTMPPVTRMLLDGNTPEQILEKTLPGFELEIFDSQQVEYRCDCSQERVERAFMTMQPDEIRGLADESGKAEALCHFCNKKYYVTRERLEELATLQEQRLRQNDMVN